MKLWRSYDGNILHKLVTMIFLKSGPRILVSAARQPALPWQVVCNPIVVSGLRCMHVCMCEVDTITYYWVMAYFSCIHYVPVWPWPLTYLHRKLAHVTRTMWWIYHKVNWSLRFEICGHKLQISWLRCWATAVAMATILCPLVGVVLDLTTNIELLQFITEYVTWPCDLDLQILESCHVMLLG